ncbi:PspC domain-containing protein [Gilvimarinus sp. F26214L]|uniref:PspC domain-containing protein n=1 Tax=Gilvimarinus sp. DZF01 TaxID=3461371 RepID=UPI004045820B
MNGTDKHLHLNRKDGMIGGVCAGLADYFGVSTFLVRVAFVIATFFWPLTIAVYALLYFCLSDRPAGEIASGLADNRVCRHLKQVDYSKRLYKSRRNKKIAGVCAGLAEYFETSPFWIRLAFVGSLFFGPFAILVYIVAALIMDKEPEYSPAAAARPSDRYAAYANAAKSKRPVEKRDIRDCSKQFTELEDKLRRLEATITSKRFKLHSELNRM